MKKLFTNDKFFSAMVIFAVLGNLIFFITAYIRLGGTSFVTRLPMLISALCVLFIYSSYKKHSKNVTKGLMGAMLMGQLLFAISSLSAMSVPGTTVVVPVYVVLSAALFINHFIINSDHHSSPGMIRMNQVIVCLLTLDAVVWDVLWLIPCHSALSIVCDVACFFGLIGISASVVCVESRLDAYRIEREANGYKAE